MASQDAYIAAPSLRSLFITMSYNGHDIGTGTGFIVNSPSGPVLVTNRHNVTGRNNFDNELLDKRYAAVPNEVRICHHQASRLGSWVERVEPLVNEDGRALWLEHPTLGPRADVVAVPITKGDDIAFYSYPQENEPKVPHLHPSEAVSVIGYPFGRRAAGLPIWTTGTIASEMDLDYDNLPVFLIDCRTRSGQSGSPVILYLPRGFGPSAGGVGYYNGRVMFFLGVYSGRIQDGSDIGMVWKSSAVLDVVHRGIRSETVVR